MKAYISGALTGLDSSRNYRMIYELIGSLCRKLKIESYIPHLHADPVKNPEIPAKRVWQKDHNEILNSEITIAYVGQPSLGVGAELEITRVYNKRLVIWYFKDEKVSRMALGNPAVEKVIIAENQTDLIKQLEIYLSK